MENYSYMNYSLFRGFDQYPRYAYPAYSTYEQDFDFTSTEERAKPEVTFLPKTSSFFDEIVNNPLNATRQSTAYTSSDNEGDVSSPISQVCFSPVISSQQKVVSNQNWNMSPINVKTITTNSSNITKTLGSNTGIVLNAFTSVKNFQNQQSSLPSSEITKYTQVQKNDKFEEEELEEQVSNKQTQESVLSAQLKSMQESKIWSEEKDQRLRKLGDQYKGEWKKISKMFKDKRITSHFVKLRYRELTLVPSQLRVKFTHKEDLMIAQYFEIYGSDWSKMAAHFQDRNPIMLKNRYYSFIRKRDLLDVLLQEVRETEKNDTNNTEFQDFFKNDMHEETNVHNHPLYSSEEVLEASPKFKLTDFSLNEKINITKEKKEIQDLKSKVKSLQSMYLKTSAELKILKSNHGF